MLSLFWVFQYSTLPSLLIISPDQKVLLKPILEDQLPVYRQIASLTDDSFEEILAIIHICNTYYAICRFIERPTDFDYSKYDALSDPTIPFRSLTLEQYINNCRILNPTSPNTGLPEDVAINITLTICNAIKKLNSIGIAHLDIAPQNILLSGTITSLHATLIDFNCASFITEKLVELPTIKGTDRFVAPDLVSNTNSTDRADIYSIGCLLHYMLTGFSAKDYNLKTSRATINADLYPIIRKCIEDYDSRYRNITYLQRDLLNAQGIPATAIQKIFAHIPGFRSNKLWKKLFASYFYFAVAVSLLAISFYSLWTYELVIEFIWIFIEFLILTNALYLFPSAFCQEYLYLYSHTQIADAP